MSVLLAQNRAANLSEYCGLLIESSMLRTENVKLRVENDQLRTQNDELEDAFSECCSDILVLKSHSSADGPNSISQQALGNALGSDVSFDDCTSYDDSTCSEEDMYVDCDGMTYEPIL